MSFVNKLSDVFIHACIGCTETTAATVRRRKKLHNRKQVPGLSFSSNESADDQLGKEQDRRVCATVCVYLFSSSVDNLSVSLIVVVVMMVVTRKLLQLEEIAFCTCCSVIS